MFDGHILILSPFTERKKRKPWNKTGEKYMPEVRKQNVAETDGIILQKEEEWLEIFLVQKSAFLHNRGS